jgi:hypothetical protein
MIRISYSVKSQATVVHAHEGDKVTGLYHVPDADVGKPQFPNIDALLAELKPFEIAGSRGNRDYEDNPDVRARLQAALGPYGNTTARPIVFGRASNKVVVDDASPAKTPKLPREASALIDWLSEEK